MKAFLSLIALLALVLPPLHATQAPASSLQTQIDAIVDLPRFAAAGWGIDVVALDDGRTLYARNALQLFQPASTAKLFTAVLTMETLGPDKRLSTQLVSAAPIHHGALDGPLVLRGSGDPSLGTEVGNADWANALATQLATRGIRYIRGDLIADASRFSGPSLGSGWETSDLLGWFAAPASALSVHENTATLTVTPATRAGEPAQLTFTPAAAAPPTSGGLTTSAPHTPDDINLYRAPGATLLHVFGSIAAGTPARTYRLAIPDPAQQAGAELAAALARHGIRLDGQVRVLVWPDSDASLLAGAQTLASIDSPPIGDILKSGLKRSQNLYLQNLLQLDGLVAQATAIDQRDAPSGFLSSEAWGLRAMHAMLERIGIAPGSVSMEEGTGLARADVVTPAALVQLLRYIDTQAWASQLRDMLPVAGVDGTLQYRLREAPTVGNVHAKTGSMTHVHTLAGYVTAANGERLAFAIMLDNAIRAPDAPPSTRAIDAIVRVLADWRGQ